MRKYWILSKLQLSSLFSINKMRHGQDPEARKKNRRSLLILLVVAIAFGNMSVTYSGMFASVLKPLGQLPTLLGLIAIGASGITVMFSMFSTKGVLVGFGDYDTLMSWPVSVREIAASRVTTMYVYNFAYAAILMLPAGFVYAAQMSFELPLWFYPLYLVLTLFVPMLPTAVGCLLGVAITAASAGRKKSAMFNTVFQLIAVLGIMALSMQMNTVMTKLATVADTLSATVASVYPPAGWFQSAVAEGDVTGLLLFLLVNLAAVFLLTLGLSVGFKALNTRLMTRSRGETFRMKRLERNSKLAALYKKEAKRYFASTPYVLNTAIGSVFLLVGAVAALIFRGEIGGVVAQMNVNVSSLLPLLIGWMVAMSCTTGSAISIEGKQFWIVKSLPISARELFNAKILLSLTITVPSTLIGSVLLGIAFRVRGLDWLNLMVTPIAYALLASVGGLALNLALPKLDWKNEVEVVKQSAATLVMVFGGMALAGIPALLTAVTGLSWLPLAAAVLYFAASLVIYKQLCKNGDRKLLRL